MKTKIPRLRDLLKVEPFKSGFIVQMKFGEGVHAKRLSKRQVLGLLDTINDAVANWMVDAEDLRAAVKLGDSRSRRADSIRTKEKRR